MPSLPHLERHFTASAVIRDLVIGMSDGLTVPFALAAGLSGTLSSPRLILTAGLAELAAGSIAMGLGGYLATRGDAEHYTSEEHRERREVHEKPEVEAAEVIESLTPYGLTPEECAPLVSALRRNPERWVAFMMRFELGLTPPAPGRALTSALTIGGAYIAGGLIPLFPYMLSQARTAALNTSIAVTLLALFVFGFLKGRITGTGALRSGVQTTLIGGLAAAAAFAIARLISPAI